MIQQHNYVISLKKANERREHIQIEFGKQNIPFEFFDAITPDDLDEQSKKLGISISESILTRGEIACAMSHLSVIHKAKAENLDYVCIFEDDVYLGENIADFLNDKYVNNDVSIVKIEHNIPKLNVSLFPEKVYKARKFYRLKGINMGCGGYIVTKKGIDFITKNIKAIKDVEIDNLLFRDLLKEKDYLVWQMWPAICIQDCILYPENYSLGIMENRDEERSKRTKRIRKTLFVKIGREISRNIRRMRWHLLDKRSYFK
ncbi:glycosyltransferase family 25 protein [Bibersteinia trehalosi]|uniref:glycosyltransferase family 25 protein n=1 Tax=Bibersteinia trehalosi TaxID=47735 RepID=UPI002D7813E5|nr:glycosyltransferase family 25 protein [Bibersteinia trehalosi]